MKKVAIILIVLTLSALIVAGCESKSQQTGYATYSGGAQPQGGGGCGRYESAVQQDHDIPTSSFSIAF